MSNQGIRISLNGREMVVDKGTRIEDLVRDLKGKKGSQIVAAVVNNEIRELTFPIEQECIITPVDLSSADGIRIYQRSLKFLLIKAVHDLFPDKELQVRHSVRRGVFFEIVDYKVTAEDVERLERRMRELVDQDHRYVKRVVSIDEARKIFLDQGREDRYRALEFREKDYVSIYTFDDIEDYFYGYMVPSTGYLKLFGLAAENDGIVLIVPKKGNPTRLPDVTLPKQLFDVFTEYTNWIRILGVEDVGMLNDVVKSGRIHEFILISEALHEKRIANIADMIVNQKKRIILIAGPSSSGKTTFARRLGIQLKVNGIKPLTISVDDYFVDKTRTPLDEDGKPDYESLETVDLEFFNKSMNALLKGEEIDVPTFNFITGKREFNGRKMKLDEGCAVIIEGIHALNPRLTSDIDDADKFKIYISAITSMRIDQHNRIPTTDLRLLRRMVRDNLFRGTSAPETIDMWPAVRRGEERNIFPFQQEADAMFNSSLIYELLVMKGHALPLLSAITKDMPQYSEARRLIEFLSYFLQIPADDIPPNSILREFLGGSCFK
ncbi:MAG: nucleoside kinase [Clostridiaceae bacterium]|jgi:uridine kinase|nr:nucleoside kinase [Bacillota bacterium]NLI38362.1 nucleoside kinase [Clostridiaceae bacterium]